MEREELDDAEMKDSLKSQQEKMKTTIADLVRVTTLATKKRNPEEQI